MIIYGKLINLRLVNITDANFILNLRQNEVLNSFISTTSSNLNDQICWIKNYLKREKKNQEKYFIVETKDRISCGTVRIYNIDNLKQQCIWGSFILDKNRPEKSSYEVIELSLRYAFEVLNMNEILLDVRKKNKKAIYIYEKMGFEKYKEDNENYYYKKLKK